MDFFEGLFTWLGRVALAAIFVLAAIAHYQQFDKFKTDIEKGGPLAAATKIMDNPQTLNVLAWGALGFMVVGGVLVALGYKARFGALLLLIFLGLCTYFYHNPFTGANQGLDDNQKRDAMIAFMQHIAIAGGLCTILARGAGRWSLDAADWDEEEF